MRQSRLFAIFGVTFILTVSFAFYSLYYVDHFPQKVADVRPRRLSIAELVGQLDDSDLKADARPQQRQNEASQTEKLPPKGEGGPEKVQEDRVRIEKEGPRSNTQKENTATSNFQERGVPVKDYTQNQAGDKRQEGDQSRIKQDLIPKRNVPKEKEIIPPSNRPRVFCILLTTLSTWETRARAVRDTWVQRCDVYRFFYTSHQGRTLPEAEAVALPVEDGRNHLTGKTMTALKWAYENYADSIDWFFKADDDTFVIMENLRFVAAQFRPSDPHYIGGRSKDLLKHGYNGGGAGYLLSREAARLIVKEGQGFPKTCKQDGEVEDLDIGKCLETFKVFPIDTRDSSGRLTFHPDHPYKIFARLGDNIRVYTYRLRKKVYGNPQGIRTMSPHTVSFHYVTPEFMYMYDFLLYRLVRHDETGQKGFAAPPYDDLTR